MGILERIKEEGHHGTIITYGNNTYIYDANDKCIYNAKTEHKLSWLYTGSAKKKLENHSELKSEDVSRYIILHNGKGDRLKMYEAEMKEKQINKEAI